MIAQSRTRRAFSLASTTVASIVLCLVSLVAMPHAMSMATESVALPSGDVVSTPRLEPDRALTRTAAARKAPRLVGNSKTAAGNEPPTVAQTADFSGQWVLINTTSSGPGRSGGDGRLVSIASGAPVNCGLECTMTQDARTLTIDRTLESPNAAPPDIGHVVMYLDGSDSTITQGNGGQFTAQASWDGSSLVVFRSIVPGALTVTQTLSREGNMLTVVHSFSPGSPVTMTYMQRRAQQALARQAVITARVDPVYPVDAEQANQAAVVVARLFVNAAGEVDDARIVTGASASFDDAVLAAVRRWRFGPTLRDDQAAAQPFSWLVVVVFEGANSTPDDQRKLLDESTNLSVRIALREQIAVARVIVRPR